MQHSLNHARYSLRFLTQLECYRKDVETLNTQHLQALPGKVMTFQAQDSGDTQALSILQRHCPAKSQLTLKVGAQVSSPTFVLTRMRLFLPYTK